VRPYLHVQTLGVRQPQTEGRRDATAVRRPPRTIGCMLTTLTPPESELRLVNAPVRLWRGTSRDLRDLVASRNLLRALVSRELRSRYKGSTLGWAWALVRPLVMLLIYGLAVGVFLGAGRSIPQFMLFIYSGLIAWGLFAAIVMGSISSLVANGTLISRASFPRLVLPLAVLLAAIVDFVLQASVLVVGYLIVGDWPQPRALLWLPPAMFILLLTALGIGLMLAAVNVYVRDIAFLTDVALQVGFWMVPVVYSYGQVVRGSEEHGWPVAAITQIYMANPMSNVVLAFQRALWPRAASPEASAFAFPGRLELRLLVFSIAGVAIAWLGMRIFVRLSGNFGQEL
jgi:ABC-2 type transport system permease protein